MTAISDRMGANFVFNRGEISSRLSRPSAGCLSGLLQINRAGHHEPALNGAFKARACRACLIGFDNGARQLSPAPSMTTPPERPYWLGRAMTQGHKCPAETTYDQVNFDPQRNSINSSRNNAHHGSIGLDRQLCPGSEPSELQLSIGRPRH